jgi:hypothetical protein
MSSNTQIKERYCFFEIGLCTKHDYAPAHFFEGKNHRQVYANSNLYSLLFRDKMKVLTDVATHSDHGLHIRCKIGPRLGELSRVD